MEITLLVVAILIGNCRLSYVTIFPTKFSVHVSFSCLAMFVIICFSLTTLMLQLSFLNQLLFLTFYSQNRHLYVPDRFLMVYDLRMMRAIMPIQMVCSPYLLRFVPAFSSRFCVVSQTGQFQLLDASASLQTPFIQNVDLPPGTSITSFDISNSGQALAFADDTGFIYLYGASDEVVFNNFSQPTEFADHVSLLFPLQLTSFLIPVLPPFHYFFPSFFLFFLIFSAFTLFYNL